MKTLIPTFCATAVMFIACVRAADKVYVDEVAAFGKVVDIWPELAAKWLKRTFKMPVK